MSRVLLVEDEEVLRDAYEQILQSSGEDVELARNGVEALERCSSTTYDLILLDLMMPVLDGIGFLKEANLRKVSPRTKIVVFSNLSSGGNVSEALELGADEHVLKSDLTPKDLLELVEQRGRRKRQAP
jgi:CheY-like chemotaxis protein